MSNPYDSDFQLRDDEAKETMLGATMSSKMVEDEHESLMYRILEQSLLSCRYDVIQVRCYFRTAYLQRILKQSSPPWPVKQTNRLVSESVSIRLLFKAQGWYLKTSALQMSFSFIQENLQSIQTPLPMLVWSPSQKLIEPNLLFLREHLWFSGIIKRMSQSANPLLFKWWYIFIVLDVCLQLQKPIEDEIRMALLAVDVTIHSRQDASTVFIYRYHSQREAISHRARWYFGELSSFLPRLIPLPTRDCGVGGFGMLLETRLNKQSKIGVIELSPIEQAQKYYAPIFLAKEVASAFWTAFLEVEQRSTLLPTNSLVGISAFSVLSIHFCTFSKVCLFVTSKMQMTTVLPKQYLKVESEDLSLLGISQQLMRKVVSSSRKLTD